MSTAIQWTDRTDNIIVVKDGGWWCRKCGEDCIGCYAEALNDSAFFGGNHLRYAGQPPQLSLRTEIIGGWARQTKPKRHFVASMTDVFGEWVPFEMAVAFLRGMAKAPRQTFQVLTKRPHIARDYINRWLAYDYVMPDNIWIGCSAGNQKRFDERVPALLQCESSVRFLSLEPLLGPIECERTLSLTDMSDGSRAIKWVIVGGESDTKQHKARPCNIAWIRSLVTQCRNAGVACFVKQLGSFCVTDEYIPNAWPEGTIFETNPACSEVRLVKVRDLKGGDITEWPPDLRIRQFPA